MQTIAVVVTDDINPFLLSIPSLVFSEFAPEGHRRHIRLCTLNPGTVRAAGNLTLTVAHDLNLLDDADIICIPFWPHPDQRPPQPLLEKLRRRSREGTLIIGLCLGAFVLGYAGLLDGKLAATHWYWADTFEKHFPLARLNRNALYEDDGTVITSAGIAAGLDCCLHILRRLEGTAVANTVSRFLVAPPFREGGQAQFIEAPLPLNTADQRINRVIENLQTHLNRGISWKEEAQRSAMSLRTFYRAFQRASGLTPQQWLLAARLKKAQQLLESTDAAVGTVATDCGFTSDITFRQRFKARFGVSPQLWRRTFRHVDLQQ